MSDILQIMLYAGLAGVAIPIGGLLARIEHLGPDWLENEFRHFVIAFGGGILLGAVSLVLVPEGLKGMDMPALAIITIVLGGLCFFAIERAMGLQRRESPQLMGMMLDYIPEAIALGGLMATGSPTAALMALLIGLQNLPEGFNAYRELNQISANARRSLRIMYAFVPLGPIAGLLGYLFLGDAPGILGGIMLFASGGILYLIFQDIAPQSRLDKHWAPPLGAVMGFCLALAGTMLSH